MFLYKSNFRNNPYDLILNTERDAIGSRLYGFIDSPNYIHNLFYWTDKLCVDHLYLYETDLNLYEKWIERVKKVL
jgi:hypothetical protein